MSEDTPAPAPAPVQAGKTRNWKGARISIMLSGVVVVLAVGVLLVMNHIKHPAAKPPTAAPVPPAGGTRLIGGRGYEDPVYRAQARRYQQRQEKAQSSYIRTPTGMFRHAPHKTQAPAAARAVGETQYGLSSQQRSGPRRPPPGSKEIGQLLTSWSRPGGVLTQEGILSSRRKASASSGSASARRRRGSSAGHTASKVAANRRTPRTKAHKTVVIPAGHILYGVTITAVDSRVNGPVVCRLVSGAYRGDNLIGAFQDTSNRLVLHFTKLVARHSGRSIAIDALAVSPKTGTTFLHGNVDHHYFERFGLMAGAAYLQGYGQAFQNAGTTTVTGSGLAVQSSSASKYAGQAALGTMGQDLSQSMSQNANIKATVSLPSGAAMGVLFMAPVTRTGGGS